MAKAYKSTTKLIVTVDAFISGDYRPEVEKAFIIEVPDEMFTADGFSAVLHRYTTDTLNSAVNTALNLKREALAKKQAELTDKEDEDEHSA